MGVVKSVAMGVVGESGEEMRAIPTGCDAQSKLRKRGARRARRRLTKAHGLASGRGPKSRFWGAGRFTVIKFGVISSCTVQSTLKKKFSV